MSRPEPRGRHRERGTATLEVAGLAPLVLMVTMAMLYGGFALYGIGATQTAARHGARAASLGDDPAAAARAALPRWLTADVSTMSVDDGTLVRVRTDLPDVLPGTDLVVTREAVMP